MKKKIIAILTVCAALLISICSILPKASAAEEDEPAVASMTYEDNIYQGMSYREESFTNPNGSTKMIHTQNFNGDEKTTVIKTNYMTITDSVNYRDMLISMEFYIGDAPNQALDFIFSGNGVITAAGLGYSSVEFYDADFNYLGGTYLSQTLTAIERVSNGSIIRVNAVITNSYYKNNAKYFTVVPKMSLPDGTGQFLDKNGNSIKNMHVSFIENDSITSSEQLENLDVEYRYKTTMMTWNSSNLGELTSNYLLVSNSNPQEFFDSFIQNLSVVSPTGSSARIKCYSLSPSEMQEQGGIYEYVIIANEADNYEFLIVSIVCSDTEAPTIIGTKEYNVPSGSLLQVSSIKSTLTAIDNVSSENEITITMKYDYYTGNHREPGTYYVCFIATDKDGNVSEDFIVKINVLDKEPPKFYDKNGRIVSSTKVYKSTDSILVLSDITNNLKAVDAIDGELDITVKNNTYVGNGDKPGQYYITLRAVDSSGNGATYNITVYVKEEMPKCTILIDGKTIIVDKHVKLVKDDFHTILKMLNKYDPSTSSYTNINDEIYKSSYKEVGDYLVDYNIVATNGQEISGVFTIKVIESRTDGAFFDEKEEEPGVIESIFTWLWNLIVSFFEWLGSLFTGTKN